MLTNAMNKKQDYIYKELNVIHIMAVLGMFMILAHLSQRLNRVIKVSKGAKIRNQYNQVPHLISVSFERYSDINIYA